MVQELAFEAFRSALGLPPSDGWEAQQRLAAKARSISQYAIDAQPDLRPLPKSEAEKLRTDVMAAYQK